MNSNISYLYRITNTRLNRHYIGSRTGKVDPVNDLGKKYFSSSLDREFRKDQQKNPNDYQYKIIVTSKSRKRILELEVRYHKIFDVGVNPKFYNRARQTSAGFNTTGTITVKDSAGNTFRVSVNDPRYLSGELVHIATGTVNVKDLNGNCFQVSVDDPRYRSGKLVPIAKGTLNVKDSAGNTFRVSVNDPRYISGELVPITKGTVTVKDSQGNTSRVSVDDPRYLSGELVPLWKGRKHSKETTDKMKRSCVGKQAGKRNSQYGTIWICNIDSKENRKVDKNLPIPEGWIKGRAIRK